MNALLRENRAINARNISGMIKNQTASENPQRKEMRNMPEVPTKRAIFSYMLSGKDINQRH
jgi:hypothetical protein